MRIGHTQELVVVRIEAERAILADEEGAEVPLVDVDWSATSALRPWQRLDAFVYTGSRGEPLASTLLPRVERDRCATLEVVDSGPGGAFLDWGLKKHLLLPFAEQRRPVEPGKLESVLVYLDNTGRLAATSRLDHHLTDRPQGFVDWQQVELLVYQRTDLGFKAVIDDRATGLLYGSDIFRSLHVGTRLPGYVRGVREDGRVDLALQPPAREVMDELAGRVLERLRASGGTSALTDRSPPESIYAAYQVSKKNYKRALGSLYKARRVRLEADRVVLVNGPADDGTARS